MKRGTTPVLKVKLNVNNADITSIDFLFKQDDTEECTTQVEKSYIKAGGSSGVEYDSTGEYYKISFTEAETRTFAEEEPFFMDTQITLTTGKVPATNIVRLMMNKTLFAEEEE